MAVYFKYIHMLESGDNTPRDGLRTIDMNRHMGSVHSPGILRKRSSLLDGNRHRQYIGDNDGKGENRPPSSHGRIETALSTTSSISPGDLSRSVITAVPVDAEDKGIMAVERSHLVGLYSRIGLLVMEIQRLHALRKREDGQRSEGTGSDSQLNTQQQSQPASSISEQMYAELEGKFNALLQKYGEAREETERLTIEIDRLRTDLRSRDLEIEHLHRESEEAAKATFVDKSDVYNKYKGLEETNARLEGRISALEGEAELSHHLQSEMARMSSLHQDRLSQLERVRVELQLSLEETALARGLVAAREKELDKVNNKNSELLKIAQEYTHVKQLLEIARRDIDTYREAFQSREKLLGKMGAETSKVEALSETLQERDCRIAFLEEEIKRVRDRVEEKETQLEMIRARIIDQDLERFRNSELSTTVNQLRAKIDFIEKKHGLKEEENAELQKRLMESTAKIEELKTLEIKLDQVSSERADLLSQIYQLRKELLEIAKLEEQIKNMQGQAQESQILIARLKGKIEKYKEEGKELRARAEESKTTIQGLQKELKEMEEVKTALGESRESLKEAREENFNLKNTNQEITTQLTEADNLVSKLRNELKESAEKNKTKMSMLAAENTAMEEKLRRLSEVEKRLEKSQGMVCELRSLNDNLTAKADILGQEVRDLESTLGRLKEINTQLENRVNILREVEAKNKDLQANVDTLGKDLLDTSSALKRAQTDLAKGREESEKMRVRIAEMREEKDRIESERDEVTCTLEKTIQEGLDAKRALEEKVESERENGLNWQKKFEELNVQFERYIREYEIMSNKFERMSAVNEDHIKDIENKAFTIAQLQKRLLVQMIELTRIDFLRSSQPN